MPDNFKSEPVVQSLDTTTAQNKRYHMHVGDLQKMLNKILSFDDKSTEHLVCKRLLHILLQQPPPKKKVCFCSNNQRGLKSAIFMFIVQDEIHQQHQ